MTGKLIVSVRVNGATHTYQDVDQADIALSDGSGLTIVPGPKIGPAEGDGRFDADEIRINPRYDTAAAVFLPTPGAGPGGPIRIRMIAAERTR